MGKFPTCGLVAFSFAMGVDDRDSGRQLRNEHGLVVSLGSQNQNIDGYTPEDSHGT